MKNSRAKTGERRHESPTLTERRLNPPVLLLAAHVQDDVMSTTSGGVRGELCGRANLGRPSRRGMFEERWVREG